MQSPTGDHDLHFAPPALSITARPIDSNRFASRIVKRNEHGAGSLLLQHFRTLLTHRASSVLSFPFQITVSG
jgi:hypothetical protein